MTKFVGTLSKWRNRVLHLGLHHFNPPYQWLAHKTMASLGRASMGDHTNKGMHTQACMNEAQMNYSFLALFNSPPPMYPRGPIYNPSIGSEGSSESVSRNIEGQRSSNPWLNKEKSKIFYFWAHFPMYAGHSGTSCMCTWDVSLWPMYSNVVGIFKGISWNIKSYIDKMESKEST